MLQVITIIYNYNNYNSYNNNNNKCTNKLIQVITH